MSAEEETRDLRTAARFAIIGLGIPDDVAEKAVTNIALVMAVKLASARDEALEEAALAVKGCARDWGMAMRKIRALKSVKE